MLIVEMARDFAAQAHAGQIRKGAGQEPYVVHLEEVAALTARFGADERVIAAAWLHDTVEDCDVLPTTLADLFGNDIAALVAELTDDKTLPKAERKARQVAHAPKKSPGAALVKICDKMSNIRAVADAPPLGWSQARRLEYLDWAACVVAALPEGHMAARSAFTVELTRARAVVLNEVV